MNNIIQEIKNTNWQTINSEDELITKLDYWKDRLSLLFPESHKIFTQLNKISPEPDATHPKLYNKKKDEKIKKCKKELNTLFSKIPDFYKKLPVSNKSIEDIIKQEESHYLEFKPSLTRGTNNETGPERIVKTIAGFLNSDGGILIIGINDDKTINGINQDYTSLDLYKPKGWDKGFQPNKDGFLNCLITIIKEYFSDLVIVKYITKEIEFYEINNKEICKINIKKSKEPVVIKYKFLKDAFFIREGNSTRNLHNPKDLVDYVYKNF